MVYIHEGDKYLFFIFDKERSGYLTWDDEEERFILAWTSESKAIDYNEKVLANRQGEIRAISNKEARKLVEFLLKSGIQRMILDFPVAQDRFFQVGEDASFEERQNYAVVDLRKVKKLWD